MDNYAELMFTEAVAALQQQAGSHERFEVTYPRRTRDELGADEIAYIESRRSFYLASLSENGWPYVQHRGGEAGFVKVTGPTQIACADYRGNQQFITQGNLHTQSRVSIFMIDYLLKGRLKLQGHATLTPVEEADPTVTAQLDLSPPAERVLLVDIVAIDWNCPKYIPDFFPRDFVMEAIRKSVAPLHAEIASLKAQLAEKEG